MSVRAHRRHLLLRLLGIAISTAGIGVSYKLTMDHGRSLSRDGLLGGICSGFESADCGAVNHSRWATIPFGAGISEPHVPLAQLGLFYFTGVLICFALAGRGALWPTHLLLICSTAAGFAASAFLEVVMWTRLEQWCPLCLAVHIASLLLFACALLLWLNARVPAVADRKSTPRTPDIRRASIPSRRGDARFPASIRPSRQWPRLASTLAIVMTAVGAEFFFLAPRPAQSAANLDPAGPVQDAYAVWRNGPTLDISVASSPSRGPTNAQHTVVVYSDFQCQTCGGFEEWFQHTILPLGDDPAVGGIRFIFKHWPISTDCNPQAVKNAHPQACEAALAAEAARIVGGDDAFWRMHDLLFQRQGQWKRTDAFAALAKEIGLDVSAFRTAMNAGAARGRVLSDVAETARPGRSMAGLITGKTQRTPRIDGTPAVFVDGKRLSAWRDKAVWTKILGLVPAEQ